MAILNYTTKVKAEKTVLEIQTILSKNGASKIMCEYDNGMISQISFIISINGMEVPFKLPNNWQGCLKAMQSNKKVTRSFCNEQQARNVSWRIIKDWVEAQLAIVEANQASLATIFLPYGTMKNGKTVAENMLNGDTEQYLMITTNQ